MIVRSYRAVTTSARAHGGTQRVSAAVVPGPGPALELGSGLSQLREPGPGRMRAWRVHSYGSPSELRLDEARVPAVRAPRDVLVRVHAASLNPLDVAMTHGYGARALNAMRALEGGEGAEGVEFPLVLGRDFVGEVALVGSESRLRRGQIVWGVCPPHSPGSHADYVLVKDCWVGEAPSALGASAGGALYAALTATAALRAAGLGPGRALRTTRRPRVLLLALGGVGHAALQLLAHLGAEVVVGCSRELHEQAAQLGAAVTLDRHDADYDRQLVEAGPYEAILDCAGLGGAEAGARAWQFARYVTLTTPLLRETDQRGLCVGLAVAASTLVRQCMAVASRPAPAPAPSSGPCLPPHVRWAYFVPWAPDIELLRRLAERGQFRVQVELVYPWWQGAAAYERAAQGSARGKLLIDFTATPPPAANTVLAP